MSKSKSPTEWLSKILTDLTYPQVGKKPYPGMRAKRVAKAEQAILNHVEELVNKVIGSGESEYESEGHYHRPSRLTDIQARNKLRAEQHVRKQQLLKGKD